MTLVSLGGGGRGPELVEGWSEGVDKGSDAGRVSLLDKLKYFPPSGFGSCSEVGIEVIAENQRVRGWRRESM